MTEKHFFSQAVIQSAVQTQLAELERRDHRPKRDSEGFI